MPKKFSKSLRLLFSKYPYRNLVIKGGGIRGIAYIGALEVLEKEGILEGIERVAGASAGAITALLVSFRVPVSDVLELFNSLDFTKIPQASTRKRKRFQRLYEQEESLGRLFKVFGWYSSDYFYQWLQEVVAKFCDGDPRATFADFHKYGYRDLYVITSNLSKYRGEIFSYESTPDVAVADAVRMSMTIPLYFEAMQFDGMEFGKGDFYVDGGLFNNFPIQIFDQDPYIKTGKNKQNKPNPQTLGLYLIPEFSEEPPENKLKPNNIWDFLELMIGNMYASQQTSSYLNNLIDQQRSIAIGDRGIESTDFSIEKNDEKYTSLRESGRQAAEEFVKAF